MAAPKTQGSVARLKEQDDANRSGVGGVDREDSNSEDCILEPLSLPESPGGTTTLDGSPSVPCIFCEEHFPVAEQDKLLKHMIIEHKLVIADVKLVADFQRHPNEPQSRRKYWLFILCWKQMVIAFITAERVGGTDVFQEDMALGTATTAMKIEIIGGTGLDDPEILEGRTEKYVDSPFAKPSDASV
ncbi:Zinc finger protein 277 [Sciurus carolinensis]|uniref:Zinc finger protein 277 n=1 Tax=Sciurus carolinensis TaxID=30640 RepID=A0AA41MVA4_SCICA|nr:Zinc finger protein 277 [Sciurus carolinensis]